MKWIIFIPVIFWSCSHPFEMEEISKDVLKSKEGVEIEVRPVPKGT